MAGGDLELNNRRFGRGLGQCGVCTATLNAPERVVKAAL